MNNMLRTSTQDIFRSEAARLMIVRIVGVLLSFTLGLGIARWFGAEAAGLYYLYLSLLLGGSLLARRGLDAVAIKQTAVDLDQNNRPAAFGCWLYCIRSTLGTALLMMLGGICIWLALPDDLLIGGGWVVAYCSIVAIPLHAMHMVNLGALRGGARQSYAATLEVLVIPAVALCGLLACWLVGAINGATPILLHALGTALVFVLGFVSVRKWLAGGVSERARSGQFRSVSSSFFAVGISAFIVDWSATYVLSIFSPLNEVGIYNVCLRIVAVGGLVLTIFNNINAPQFAVAFRKGQWSDAGDIARRGAQSCFLVGGVVLVPAFIWAEEILGLIGEEFISGVLIIRIMVLAQLVNMFSGSVGHILLMSGNEGLLKRLSYGALALQLVFIGPAVYVAGAEGAALTWAVVGVTRNGTAICIAYRKAGVLVIPDLIYRGLGRLIKGREARL